MVPLHSLPFLWPKHLSPILPSSGPCWLSGYLWRWRGRLPLREPSGRQVAPDLSFLAALCGPGGLEGAEVSSSGQWWLPAVPHPLHAELPTRAPGEGPRAAAGLAVFRAPVPLPSALRDVRVSPAAHSSTSATMEAQAQGGWSPRRPEVWS